MDLDIAEWLEELATKTKQTPEVQKLAQKLWDQWQSGITVSPKEIKRLRQLKTKSVLCARLNSDGSCDWLKKNAVIEHVVPPRPGQKAFCHRRRG